MSILNWGIRAKLVAICMALASITVLVGGVSYFFQKDVIARYNHVATVNLPNTDTIGDMLASYRRVRILLRTLGLPGVTREQGEKEIAGALKAIEEYEEADKRYNSIPFVEGEGELYKPVSVAWKHFKSIGERVITLYRSGTPQDIAAMHQIFLKDCPEAAVVFTDAIIKLSDFQSEQARKWSKMAEESAARANLINLIIVCGGFVFALFTGIVFSNSLSSTLMGMATRLSQGSDEVANAATEIQASSESLSSSVTEQAAALQETAASLEEMTAMINKNAENARKSTEYSGGSRESAVQGKQVIDEMIRAIEEINQSNASIMTEVENSNKEIAGIVAVIHEIGNKTKVINDIVFQTRLLSFNASVEAARAGEHGKGFAVVAEEVGNLAQMSGNSAREITAMLEGSVQKVETIVNETGTKVSALIASGKDKVEKGTRIARRCGEVLDEIVGKVESVNSMSGEISAASQEQSSGIREINRAMSQLDQATQQNSSSSQQAASAASQLASQAEVLRAAVNELQRTILGGGAGASAGGTPAGANLKVVEDAQQAPVRKAA